MKNYSNVLAWICRLRQACLHPSLVTTFNEELSKEQALMRQQNPSLSEEEIRTKTLEKMADSVVERLVTQEVEDEG